MDVKASIATDLEGKNIVAVLNHNNFGIKVDHVGLFQSKYCDNKQCKLYVHVNNSGHQAGRFSLTFTHDRKPFQLKEGEQIFLPAS